MTTLRSTAFLVERNDAIRQRDLHYKRKSRAKGDEALRQREREYQRMHPLKRSEAALQLMREYQKRYRTQNVTAVREYQKRYRTQNVAAVRQRKREWSRTKGRFMVALVQSRARANTGGYVPCSATAGEIASAFNGHCHNMSCRVLESDCRRKLHLDHDHQTGKFRGWLCRKCNVAL